MSEFSLPVVRESVALTLFASVAAIEKHREKRVRSILARSAGGQASVYCHFERHGGSLHCAFSNSPGYLLGEVVRDWLWEEHGARDFLWCEELDGEMALVLVIGGRVVKDALVGASRQNRELQLAISSLGAVRDSWHLFVHRNLALPEEEVDADKEILSTGVRERIGNLKSVRKKIPELGSIEDIAAVKRWNLGWRLARFVGLAAVLAGVSAAGVLWWQSREPPVEELSDTPTGPSREDAYKALLRTPDPSQLIPAIHHAYREFLGDPLFGEHWHVQSLRWDREGGKLRIQAALPTGTGKAAQLSTEQAEEKPIELDKDLQDQIRARAATRGWSVDLAGPSAVFRLPVAPPPRNEDQAKSLRLPEPTAEGDPWHRQRLMEDLGLLGAVRAGSAPIRNRIYYEYPMTLEIRDAEWATADSAAWLAARLGGGPVVLDSVIFETTTGAAMNGEVGFRAMWCEVDPPTGRCAEPI